MFNALEYTKAYQEAKKYYVSYVSYYEKIGGTFDKRAIEITAEKVARETAEEYQIPWTMIYWDLIQEFIK